MERLLIIGTGDYATVAFFYLKNEYNIIGFSEEKAYRKLKSIQNLPIYDFEDLLDLFDPKNLNILVAVGPNYSNTIRERLFTEVKIMNFKCITYIHPDATVWDKKAIGENSFIFPNAVLEPYATVGNNCVMWSGSIISHHSKLHDNCFMAPGALVSGRTIINSNCFLGINSTIRENLIVKEKCIIGAGAVIKKDTVENGVYSSDDTKLFNQNSFETKL